MKKVTLGTTIAAVLLGCLVTFQVTYIFLTNSFEKKYFSEAVNSVSVSVSDGSSEDTASSSSSSSSSYSSAASSEFLERVTEKLTQIDAYYRSYYLYDLDDDALIDGIMEGYVEATGDKYGHYYNAETFNDFVTDQNGEMVGIGISVIYNEDYKCVEVLNIMPDSPALEAGVQVGDLIWTVGTGDDAEYVSDLGYYEAVNRLQGDIGTVAEFTVRRGENYSETVEFSITRAKVTELSVMYHVYSPDTSIGVIKITGFDAKTPDQFEEAVDDLTKQGCDKLIIDLRYNPGGELTSIVTILDYIVPEGPVIRIFDRDGNQVNAYYSDSSELDIPMAVVVNGSTASAAELFTSCVKDYNKATIVGTTTYGKGCMQTTVELTDGSAITFTYRMYNPPFSDNYHGVGITPDVEVDLDEELKSKNIYKITDEEDNQLAAAAATFYDETGDN